jgi:uncharacterized protein
MLLTYLDTSIVLSLHLPDGRTDAVMKALNQLRGGFAVSAWTRTEIASALGILVRRKAITAPEAQAIFDDAAAFCSDCQLLPVTAAAYALATRWLLDFDLGLRAGDALHAAICKLNEAQLLSTDVTLVNASEALELQVWPLQ